MKVKIGDVTHDCEKEPIMLILEPIDRVNIASMPPHATKYCAFPAGLSETQVRSFMGIAPALPSEPKSATATG